MYVNALAVKRMLTELRCIVYSGVLCTFNVQILLHTCELFTVLVASFKEA